MYVLVHLQMILNLNLEPYAASIHVLEEVVFKKKPEDQL